MQIATTFNGFHRLRQLCINVRLWVVAIHSFPFCVRKINLWLTTATKYGCGELKANRTQKTAFVILHFQWWTTMCTAPFDGKWNNKSLVFVCCVEICILCRNFCGCPILNVGIERGKWSTACTACDECSRLRYRSWRVGQCLPSSWHRRPIGTIIARIENQRSRSHIEQRDTEKSATETRETSCK